MRKPYVAVVIYDAKDEVIHRKDYVCHDLEEAEVFAEVVEQTHCEQFRRVPDGSIEEILRSLG